jgi:hypothetical protein
MGAVMAVRQDRILVAAQVVTLVTGRLVFHLTPMAIPHLQVVAAVAALVFLVVVITLAAVAAVLGCWVKALLELVVLRKILQAVFGERIPATEVVVEVVET